MINRDDMLELTRRLTPARSSVGRIAGAYFDEESYADGTFNTNFLKLSQQIGQKILPWPRPFFFRYQYSAKGISADGSSQAAWRSVAAFDRHQGMWNEK